jgi:signal transduction histidine kinase
MFKEARIKLTAWYLAIIMAISLSFSGVIYVGVNRELTRLENFQRTRIQGIMRGFSVSAEIPSGPDSDIIAESRTRIILTLGLINLSILILSGLGGYFLAGQTLDPIKRMVDKQKEFVSNASHELRTPLTSLKTEIEVALRDKKMTLKDARSLFASNLEDVDKMQKLSNYLLKLNRYEKDDSINFSKVDLKEVVLKAVKNFKFKFDLKLQKSVVTGNEDSLIDLTTILLDNAIKYGNGKKIEVRTKKIGILEVTDHGLGIAEKDIPHIFDRFYRADASRNKDKNESYGLGLSIAKSIVELHKGSIEVKSRVGKGTTFSVIF